MNSKLTDNEPGLTELMLFVQRGDFSGCNKLIEEGCDINQQDSKGATALIYAALNNNEAITNLLLFNGADRNIATNNGLKALAIARNNDLKPLISALSDDSESIENSKVEPIETPKVLGVKWLRFWVYVKLPIDAIVAIIFSIISIKTSPVVFFIMAPWAVLCLSVAYGLHHRKLWAWKWNWLVIALLFVSIVIDQISTKSHGMDSDFMFNLTLSSVLGLVLLVCPSYVYWNNRKHLFHRASLNVPVSQSSTLSA